MHNMQIKMKFIQLKAEGIPMYKIANALGVHRTTLTLWYKELAEYILIAKQDYLDELLYENEACKLNRIERLSRHLTILYRMLDEPEKMVKAGMNFSEVLDLIAKFTKILHLETNEKHLERHIKNNHKEKTIPDDSDKKDEAVVWVTDMEKFRKFQPDETAEMKSFEEGTDKEIFKEEIIRETAAADSGADLDAYLDAEITRDFKDEDEEIQQIFNRTIAVSRTRGEINMKNEGGNKESVKNPSKKKNSETKIIQAAAD